MSVARTALGRPAASRRGALRLDAHRLLLIAANVVGGLCIVTSISGWWGLADRTVLDALSFEALVVLSTVLFFLSALAQPGRWRRPWLLVSAGLFAVLLGSLITVAYGALLGYVPSPSWADVFFLAFYPLSWRACCSSPKP